MSRHELGVLMNVQDQIKLLLGDADLYVVAAALGLLRELSRVRMKSSGSLGVFNVHI